MPSFAEELRNYINFHFQQLSDKESLTLLDKDNNFKLDPVIGDIADVFNFKVTHNSAVIMVDPATPNAKPSYLSVTVEDYFKLLQKLIQYIEDVEADNLLNNPTKKDLQTLSSGLQSAVLKGAGERFAPGSTEYKSETGKVGTFIGMMKLVQLFEFLHSFSPEQPNDEANTPSSGGYGHGGGRSHK